MTLDSILLHNQAKIENWFEQQTQTYPPLFYSSVDLRNAGFKTAPVDTNIFPAGFNNLDPATYPLCIQALKQYLKADYPDAHKIMLIPESHTRNPFYFDNLFVLTELIRQAGYKVEIGSLLDLDKPQSIALSTGRELLLKPIQVGIEGRLSLDNFNPDLIILNNDLSEGLPAILKNIIQPIIPAVNMGWYNRRKTSHFALYEKIATDFANFMAFDPWLINPLFTSCDNLSFLDLEQNQDSKSELISKVSSLFQAIEQKYKQYHIQSAPFVVIKSDTGTYGIAVMMIQSVEALLNLNRKQRTKMSIGKGKQAITKIMIQEGIPTIELSHHLVCEPVIYSIGKTIVGGFYRNHKNKGPLDNLNTPGMHFHAMHDLPYAYSVVTRLTQLAASLENQQQNKQDRYHD